MLAPAMGTQHRGHGPTEGDAVGTARRRRRGGGNGTAGARRRALALAGGVAAALVLVVLAPSSAASAQEGGADPATEPEQPGQEQPTEQPADEAQTQIVQGNLRYEEDGENVAVPDADITVESADGSFSQDVTTDADGHFEVEVPGPGRYEVTLDVATLPEGVSLEDEDHATLDRRVEAGRPSGVIFRLTTGSTNEGFFGTVRDKFDEAVDLGVDGLSLGMVIAMCAIGLSLIFGTTGLVNFAHAEMVTLPAVVAVWMNVTFSWWVFPVNLLVAAPLAIVLGGLFGWVFNRFVWRPLRNRGTNLLAMMIISIGFGIMLRYFFLLRLGASDREYAQFTLQREYDWGALAVAPRELWLIGISALLLVGIGLYLQHTLTGTAMRAVSDNRDLAESSGIDVEKIIGRVWIAGGALAAVGGLFLGLLTSVEWQMGFNLLLLIFAGVILGGIGTTYGAVVGSLIIGLFVQLSALVIDTELRNAGALVVLILVLLVRPQGIFGQAERIG
jgi:branched-chain amino acid transport system permease protein